MALSDAKGLAVSTTSTDALAAYERGVDLFLRWRAGAMEALDASAKADPNFALVHCTRAYIAWRMGRVDLASAAADRAAAVADSARTERERIHVAAVAQMHRAQTGAAYETLGKVAADDPRDRMAVRIVGLNCITQGNYRGGIDIARRSLAADPGEPQFETMLGFFLEQSGYNDEGLEWSSRSLARDPTNLYTYHAVGHAYQARGDYRRAVETFSRATSLERYAHLLWHLAEAQAILGHERLTRDYWAAPSPGLPLYERIELLWRLEFLRHAPTDDAVWRDLAAQADRVLEHADYQTTWMHHWIGLAYARAGQRDKAAGSARAAAPASRRAPERLLVDAGRVPAGGRARDHRRRSGRRGQGDGPRGGRDPQHGRRQPRAERHLPRRVHGGAPPPRQHRGRRGPRPGAPARQPPPHPVARRAGLGLRAHRRRVAPPPRLPPARPARRGSRPRRGRARALRRQKGPARRRLTGVRSCVVREPR